MTTAQKGKQFNLREKLLTYGTQSLSDKELLTIIINSGTPQKSCAQLAEELFQHFGDLRQIINAPLYQFQKISGLSTAHYSQIQALKEICRRSDFIELQKENQIKNTKQTHAYLKRRLRDYKNETFAALFLDNQNRVIAYEELFFGTINQATIHTRPIVEKVLHFNAAAVILAHNHPSGVSNASDYDVTITKRVQEALHLIDTSLLDHLVIGDNEVYSILAECKWICN